MNTLVIAMPILVAVYIAGGFFMPLTFWKDRLRNNDNARNWPAVIVMRRGLPCPGAVWAQELYEARKKYLQFIIALPLLLFGKFFPRHDFYRRNLELMGHEVEVWAEYYLLGSDVDTVRQREAQSLSDNYPCFQGWTVTKIKKHMKERSRDAILFVRAFKSRIEKLEER